MYIYIHIQYIVYQIVYFTTIYYNILWIHLASCPIPSFPCFFSAPDLLLECLYTAARSSSAVNFCRWMAGLMGDWMGNFGCESNGDIQSTMNNILTITKDLRCPPFNPITRAKSVPAHKGKARRCHGELIFGPIQLQMMHWGPNARGVRRTSRWHFHAEEEKEAQTNADAVFKMLLPYLDGSMI